MQFDIFKETELVKSLNFIYFTRITKQVHTTYITHTRWHRCLHSGGHLDRVGVKYASNITEFDMDGT